MLESSANILNFQLYMNHSSYVDTASKKKINHEQNYFSEYKLRIFNENFGSWFWLRNGTLLAPKIRIVVLKNNLHKICRLKKMRAKFWLSFQKQLILKLLTSYLIKNPSIVPLVFTNRKAIDVQFDKNFLFLHLQIFRAFFLQWIEVKSRTREITFGKKFCSQHGFTIYFF